MNRRDSVLALIALGAAPGSVFGQSGARTYRVAVVFTGSPDSDRNSAKALTQGLSQHGYKEGANLKLELSYAEGRTDRAAALIQEAVARKPDVLVTTGSANAAAAKQATSTIPIVMATVGDPVELGLAASLARPGGNITGNTALAAAFIPKSLELLHETLPAVRSFGVLTDPAMQASRIIWSALEGTAKRLRVGLERFDASTPEDVDRVLGVLAKRRPGALLVFVNPIFGAHRKKMIESLTRERIPLIWPSADAADLGALMSHSPDASDTWRNAASFVHRILQGAKPADLPFEQPTKFDFVVNLKTAKALGIKVPQPVLLRATRVIE